MTRLEEIRVEIDSINTEIVRLLEMRMQLSEEVVDYKKERKLPIYDATREKQVLENVSSQAKEEFQKEIRASFDAIMNMSKLRQYKRGNEQAEFFQRGKQALERGEKWEEGLIKVACQGMDGSYTSLAARKLFAEKGGYEFSFYETWNDIFVAVQKGYVKYGVLPIENSTAGSVEEVYRLLMERAVFITKEIAIPIEHCLLGTEGADMDSIREVYSHPQALAQCRRYTEMGGWKEVAVTNTANAAAMVAKQADPSKGAIAPQICSDIYGLKILERQIQTIAGNTTRFVAIAKELEVPLNANKISVQFSLAHQKGTLVRVLTYFSALGLNLTKIHSMPLENETFEYRFYVDCTGNIRDPETFSFLCALEQDLPDFKVIGNYFVDIL